MLLHVPRVGRSDAKDPRPQALFGPAPFKGRLQNSPPKRKKQTKLLLVARILTRAVEGFRRHRKSTVVVFIFVRRNSRTKLPSSNFRPTRPSENLSSCKALRKKVFDKMMRGGFNFLYTSSHGPLHPSLLSAASMEDQVQKEAQNRMNRKGTPGKHRAHSAYSTMP